MHYNNLGGKTAQGDRSGVELCVVKKEHFREHSATVATSLGSFQINIPPKSKDTDVTGTCTITGDDPITLLSASPHAFNFEEQGLYDLPEPLVINKGDKLTTTCT